MKKDSNSDPPRLFRLSHQVLVITGINFEERSLVGYVELTIWPTSPDLTDIRINSKQCTIYRVSVDKRWEAEFTYFDPTLNICQGNLIKRNIDYFQKCQKNAFNSIDPDRGNGELIIKLPNEVLPTVSALGSFQVSVEFALEQPKGGVHFVVPDLPGTMAERSAHMFTYAVENSSRMWFPCVDSYSEPCTWKIEVTVDSDMTAVSCGDLVSVELTEDLREKTYHYFLSSPVAAPNIALAVGPFEILVDPKMHEVTHFCLPKLMPVLKHTTSYIHQAFEFYEELMSSRYPYSYYKQVFVDESYCEVATYSTMSILSTNLLHPPNIIDQTMASRQLMATAVAQQFFGSFIAMESWSDAWLTKGITGYLSYLFSKRTFGNNEYRNWVMRDLQEVSEYEQMVGYVILDPSKRESNHPFSTQSPHTLSPRYSDIFAKKARLVMRMLEIRIGTELLLQVLNKLLSLAYNASQVSFDFNSWTNMLVSTSSFLKIIYTVTGKDIEPFIDLWVYQGGCARFNGNFVFNRKRNVVELEIRQDLNAPGGLKYVGTLNVTIQELDGSFNHQFKIEENKTKFEITCHSKSRRNKKKKIPLMTGEEVDMDLSAMDADSPVLWLRLDPDMHLLRTVSFEQPDYMWQYQVKFERCIVAQFEAIDALVRFPTPASRFALTDTIENEECYYRVRQEACYVLTKIANAMVGTWTGPPAMMTIFRKMFGSHSCPVIIRQNNFSNFHHYYLLKIMPQAMARLRDAHNLALTEIIKFLLDLFKYNDNSRNKWSDNYFRAALVESLAATVCPAVTNVSLITGQVVTAETLSSDIKLIVEEIVRCLNLEKLLPCYKFVVTTSCLYAIRTLQKYGHLPNDSEVFKDYAQPGMFRDVRTAAVTCIVDFIKGEVTGEHLNWTLDYIENEKDPYLRHHAVTCMIENAPFKMSQRSALNIEPLVERLWNMMSHMSHDHRLRCGLADLYFTLYGRQRPTCLPIPENVRQIQKEMKPRLDPITDISSLDSGFGSQPSQGSGAQWNPELSSIFASPPHTESLPPSTVKVDLDLDTTEENSDRAPVDLTMISGEQTVGMEESVTSEPMDEGENDVKPKLESEGESTPAPAITTGVPSRQDSISHLSEDSLSPTHSPPKDHPDDVIVSLDNIIKTDPTVPMDIFAASPLQSQSPSPPPATVTLEPSPPSKAAETSPAFIRTESPLEKSPPLVVETEHDEAPITVGNDGDDVDLKHVKEEIEEPDETIQEDSSPLRQSPVATSPQPTTTDIKLEPKLEAKEESPLPQSPQPSPALQEPSPPLPEEPVAPSSPSPPQQRETSTTNITPPSPVFQPEPITTASVPSPHKRRLSVSSRQDSSEPEPKKTVPPLTVSNIGAVPTVTIPVCETPALPSLKTTFTLSSSGASVSETSSLPSLKTTFNLSAAVAASEARDRERSSHHKSKKKKKKNKHKHKHKHKHDRSDREAGEAADRPRERLVLDMSARKGSPSVRPIEKSDEQSSSE